MFDENLRKHASMTLGTNECSSSCLGEGSCVLVLRVSCLLPLADVIKLGGRVEVFYCF